MAGAERSGGRLSFVLGVDIGTTTVKVCLVNVASQVVVESRSQETKASIPSDIGTLGNEQDVHRICTALQFCVSRLPKENLARVTKIAVSGQMHGCVLWRYGAGWKQNPHGRYEVEKVSSLYTWQDGRCSSDFLAALPTPESHLRLSTGHGCATLLWLLRNRPETTENYDRAGTIQDLVVAMLCNLDVPVMSLQNAASWGYFNTVDMTWNTEKLSEAGLPSHLLPKVVPACQVAGSLHTSWYGIPEGVYVYAALGDLQCSVFSTLKELHDAALNISTSAQLSFIVPREFIPPPADPASPIEYFPYFNCRYLAVAASLNGGNVLASFVRMLQQWTHELGLGVPESKIWEIMLAAAQDETAASDITVVPTLYGERHLPSQRASVTKIDPRCLSLGKVSRAICKGIVTNLHSMMPREKLLEADVQRIVGSGNALTKNVVLQRELQQLYQLPVLYVTGTDAAIGAALAVLKYSE